MVADRAGLRAGSPTPAPPDETIDHVVAFTVRALGAVAD
jgi:hypothetical protein